MVNPVSPKNSAGAKSSPSKQLIESPSTAFDQALREADNDLLKSGILDLEPILGSEAAPTQETTVQQDVGHRKQRDGLEEKWARRAQQINERRVPEPEPQSKGLLGRLLDVIQTIASSIKNAIFGSEASYGKDGATQQSKSPIQAMEEDAEVKRSQKIWPKQRDGLEEKWAERARQKQEKQGGVGK